jgi:trehalose 6-phosphate synthase
MSYMPNAETHPQKNILIVSNRLPVNIKFSDNGSYEVIASSGGLVGALRGLSQSMKFKWYGWPGLDVSDTQKQLVKEELARHSAIPIFFNGEMADKHYTGFSSKVFQHSLYIELT